MPQSLLHQEITERILKAFFDVHWELGPGFVESVYANAMAIALTKEGLQFQREVPITVYFRVEKSAAFAATWWSSQWFCSSSKQAMS